MVNFELMEGFSSVPPFCCNNLAKRRWIVIFMTSAKNCNEMSQSAILRETRGHNFRISQSGKPAPNLDTYFNNGPTEPENTEYMQLQITCLSLDERRWKRAQHMSTTMSTPRKQPCRKQVVLTIHSRAEPTRAIRMKQTSTQQHTVHHRLPRARSHFCLLGSNTAQASR